ncbi:hypothetical protein LR48_Vigan03g115200 [Vigna angularis]|uniref:Uncharacterized protein n=1 Tax=Phaseolus angularis TaxID=3914 RepID=A0A0L9U4Q4_PHAAN|nr:hypothetical protein LR48_Vigan03g115200 [Vigna angularis]
MARRIQEELEDMDTTGQVLVFHFKWNLEVPREGANLSKLLAAPPLFAKHTIATSTPTNHLPSSGRPPELALHLPNSSATITYTTDFHPASPLLSLDSMSRCIQPVTLARATSSSGIQSLGSASRSS